MTDYDEFKERVRNVRFSPHVKYSSVLTLSGEHEYYLNSYVDGCFENCEKVVIIAPFSRPSELYKKKFPYKVEYVEGELIESYSIVNEIKEFAFKNNKIITDMILPSSIKKIGRGAFEGCKNLCRITIPRTVTKIESGTFLGCDSLSEIYYEGSKEEWDKLNIITENRVVSQEQTLGLFAKVNIEHLPGNDVLKEAVIHFDCNFNFSRANEGLLDEKIYGVKGHVELKTRRNDVASVILCDRTSYEAELAIIKEFSLSEANGIRFVHFVLENDNGSRNENIFSKNKRRCKGQNIEIGNAKTLSKKFQSKSLHALLFNAKKTTREKLAFRWFDNGIIYDEYAELVRDCDLWRIQQSCKELGSDLALIKKNKELRVFHILDGKLIASNVVFNFNNEFRVEDLQNFLKEILGKPREEAIIKVSRIETIRPRWGGVVHHVMVEDWYSVKKMEDYNGE